MRVADRANDTGLYICLPTIRVKDPAVRTVRQRIHREIAPRQILFNRLNKADRIGVTRILILPVAAKCRNLKSLIFANNGNRSVLHARLMSVHAGLLAYALRILPASATSDIDIRARASKQSIANKPAYRPGFIPSLIEYGKHAQRGLRQVKSTIARHKYHHL